jgi:hypothetical protein
MAKKAKKSTKSAKKNTKKTVKKPVKKAAEKVTKKVAKKTVKKTKKVAKVSKVKNAPADQVFFMVNGQKLKNYGELAKVLGRIEDNVFNHHVNEYKNDFVNWIRDVFKDIELAKKIAGIKDKDKMQLVIYKHIMRH